MNDKVQKSKVCIIEGCEKDIHAKERCHNHYREIRRRSSGSKERAKRPSVCVVPKCTRKHYSLNYCASHYSRFKNGTLNENVPIKKLVYNQKDCLVSFCKKPHYAAGLCRTHDATKRTYNLSSEDLAERLSRSCEVCNSSENLTIDHDHSCCNARFSCGKCVRGTLCQNCNRAIGQAKESAKRLKLLASYVDKYSRSL